MIDQSAEFWGFGGGHEKVLFSTLKISGEIRMRYF
jgi:hypothetical protein